MRRLPYFFILLLIVTLFACNAKEGAKSPVVGEKAPDFTLADLDGNKTRLSDLRGNVVLVNFWATWCPPCRDEVPSMAVLNRMMAGRPFRMLAIAIDQGGKDAVNRFYRQAGVSLPTLIDSDGRTGAKYGITGVPETFVIDRKGVIIKKIVGPLDWSAPDAVKFLLDAMKRS